MPSPRKTTPLPHKIFSRKPFPYKYNDHPSLRLRKKLYHPPISVFTTRALSVLYHATSHKKHKFEIKNLQRIASPKKPKLGLHFDCKTHSCDRCAAQV